MKEVSSTIIPAPPGWQLIDQGRRAPLIAWQVITYEVVDNGDGKMNPFVLAHPIHGSGLDIDSADCGIMEPNGEVIDNQTGERFANPDAWEEMDARRWDEREMAATLDS